MAPRGYDRYMIAHGMGTHPKLARLTDSEFRAHVVGVLAVAAMAPVRGRLLVGPLPAEPADIAIAAGVTKRVASSALRKLEAVGVLRRDEEHDCLRVHDWEDINPPPGSSTERMQRHRARQRDEISDGAASHRVTETSRAALLEVEGEVEVEVEGEVPASTTSQQVARKRASRQVDQSKLPDDFPAELVDRVDAVLPILRRCWETRGGVEPNLRGTALGVLRNPSVAHEQVALKLEHWLLAGNGQRRRCDDIARRFAEWVAREDAAPFTVISGGLEQPAAIARANAWQRGYEGSAG